MGLFLQNKVRRYKTKIFFIKGSVGLARSSNFDDFKPITYEFPSEFVRTIGTDTIISQNHKEGKKNKNDSPYDYAKKFYTDIEIYWYPLDNFGLFSNIGYSNLNFDQNKYGKDSEIYNLRLGFLLNIKSKDQNLATLQFFADRSDLSKSPNSRDENLRFGFKIALPFNFKSIL